MIILGLDLETTGLDPVDNRITEIGYVLWDAKTQYPLLLESQFVGDSETVKQNSQEIVDITGIDNSILERYAKNPKEACRKLHQFLMFNQPEYIVAHNGDNFDKPFLLEAFKRNEVDDKFITDIPWIDTRYDLPYDKQPKSNKLEHLALDAGFINPFPHRALTDVLTMLRVMAQFDFQDILNYRKIPWIFIAADVTFHTKDFAKERKFQWQECGGKFFEKQWIKKIKKDEFEAERDAASFAIKVIGE